MAIQEMTFDEIDKVSGAAVPSWASDAATWGSLGVFMASPFGKVAIRYGGGLPAAASLGWSFGSFLYREYLKSLRPA